MKERALKHIEGKKIRRQYFNFPLIGFYLLISFVFYSIIIGSVFMGKTDVYEWSSTLLTLICVGFFFSLPLLILKILNRYFFGRIVCVLTQEGIHYPHGMVRWETIDKIEYILDSKPRYKSDITKAFRVVIYTKGVKHIILPNTPLFFVSHIKKLRKDIDIKILGAPHLLRGALIMTAIVLICPFYVILLRNAPGISLVKLVAATVIMLVVTIISIPVFAAYAIEYRFWCRILPNKLLSYIILSCYYLSPFIALPIMLYFPNWTTIILVSIYIGIVNPPMPSRRGNKNRRFLSYEELYELYIVKADIWKKKIKSNKRCQH